MAWWPRVPADDTPGRYAAWCIVAAAPALDQHPGFLEAIEDLAVEALVSELADEAFIVPVLPRTAGFDLERLQINLQEPVPDRLRRKLAAVVGADVIQSTAPNKETCQDLKHIVRTERPGESRQSALRD